MYRIKCLVPKSKISKYFNRFIDKVNPYFSLYYGFPFYYISTVIFIFASYLHGEYTGKRLGSLYDDRFVNFDKTRQQSREKAKKFDRWAK